MPGQSSVVSPGQIVDQMSPSYSQKSRPPPSPPGARRPTVPSGSLGRFEYAAGSPRWSVAATQTAYFAAAG